MKKQMKASQFWLTFATLVLSTLLSFRSLVVEANEPYTPPPGEVYIHIRETGHREGSEASEILSAGYDVSLKEGEVYESPARDIAGWKLKRAFIRYVDETEKELPVEDGILRFEYGDFADKPTSIEGSDAYVELSELFHGYLIVCEYVRWDEIPDPLDHYVYISYEGLDEGYDFGGELINPGDEVLIKKGNSYQLPEPKSFAGWVFEGVYLRHADGRREKLSVGQSLSFEQLTAHPKHLVGPKKVLNGEYPPRQLEGYHVYYNYRPLVETVPVLRFYNRSTQQYAYVRHASEIARLKSSGWRSEGVAWKSFPNGEYSSYREKLHGENRGTLVGPVFVPVYRLWNRKTGEYIFTRHWQEIRFLMTRGWKYEGIAFCSQLNGQPIYRLYNSKTDRYFFTARQEEVKKLQATNVWKNEGIAFFSRP